MTIQSKAKLDSIQTQFEAYLKQVFLRFDVSQILIQAMQYAVLGGGKRIRPCLLIESCLACGGSIEQALPSAAAIELIHSYSLAHDDLPCMDNDDLRRGKPTLHKAFSEPIALLAGDALIPLAFGLVAQPHPAVSTNAQLQVIQRFSNIAGVGCDGQSGLVSGQVFDMLAAEGQLPLNETTLHQIHTGKTAALFRFSLEAGAILAGVDESLVALFAQLGAQLGLIFQIQDDILDVTATTEVLGKTAGKDAEQNKLTFPGVYGLEKSHAVLNAEIVSLNGIIAKIENQLQDASSLLALKQRVATMLERCS